MTSDAVSAGGDARRLLAETRGLAHRVRVAQRVTWLPLLVLALVTFGAIVVWRLSDPVLSDCRTLPDGQVCKAWYPSMQIYWWTATVLAYAAIAYGYLRVARARGVGTRVLPYVLTGVGLIALGAVFAGTWAALGAPGYPDEPSAFAQFVFRLVDPTAAIGLALLLLGWPERAAARHPGRPAAPGRRRVRARAEPAAPVTGETAHPVTGLDDVVHQRVRLGILTIAHEARRVEFGFLRTQLELTAGNLSQHLGVLESNGLVEVEKGYAASAPARGSRSPRPAPPRWKPRSRASSSSSPGSNSRRRTRDGHPVDSRRTTTPSRFAA